MKHLHRHVPIVLCLFALAMAAGCAKTKVSNREELVTGPITRPPHIWVYDFVASPADLPPESALADEDDVDMTPLPPEQVAEGKKLGNQIAAELVTQINAMGMHAWQATPETKPQLNDIVIRGYLLSIKEGSAVKRVAIGFGSGASGLKTLVEGFQMTDHGLRKLGMGDVNAGGGKAPGASLGVATLLITKNPVGLIVTTGTKVYGEASGSSTVEGRAKATAKEIADVLKKRFQEQGWIN